MGCNATAFVFGSEPNWDAIATLKIALRGYAHKKSPLWLLFVSPREINQHEPFVDAVRPKVNKTFLKKLDDASKESLEQLAKLEKELGKQLAGSLCTSLLAQAMEVFALSGVATYCFSGDDEGHNLGVSLSEKNTSFAVRMLRTPLALLMKNGKYTVLIDQNGLDGEFSQTIFHKPVSTALEKWKDDELYTVKNATRSYLKQMESLYGFGVSQWPTKWGDSKKLFGMGTWELFQNLDKDYRVVVEKKPQQDRWSKRELAKNSSPDNNAMHAKPGLRAGFYPCKIIAPAR